MRVGVSGQERLAFRLPVAVPVFGDGFMKAVWGSAARPLPDGCLVRARTGAARSAARLV